VPMRVNEAHQGGGTTQRHAMLTCPESIAVHDGHSTTVIIPHIKNQRSGFSRREPGSH
jgi:hypothetical protein